MLLFANRPGRRHAASAPGGALGFSLIELMVTVVVLAVVLAIAYPSFTGLINSNRLTGNANEMVAAIQLARSEAVTRNASVVLCRSDDATTCATGATWNGWITLVQSGGAPLRVSTVQTPVQIAASANIIGNNDQIVFRPDGMARDSTGALLAARFGVCIPTTRPAENQRFVNISGGSRVSVASGNGAGLCPAP
jgi:type IV fimbrial biogenesis protein FimT